MNLKTKKILKKLLSLLLILVFLSHTSFRADFYIQIDNKDYENWNILSELSLLRYSGHQRIVNGIIYNYIDGKLHNIEDAFGNRAYYIFDYYGNLVEIRFGDDSIFLNIDSDGVLNYFTHAGYTVKYRYENSILSTIETENNIIELYKNDLENSITVNNFLVSHKSVARVSRSNEINYYIYNSMETMFNGLDQDYLFSSFSYNIENELYHINFSNGLDFFIEQDLNGFYNTLLVVKDYYFDNGYKTLETASEVTLFNGNGINSITEFSFNNQAEDEFIYIMNEMGFIGRVYRNGILLYEYFYDHFTGQLISEYNHYHNFRAYFQYDDFGNILSRVIYNTLDNSVQEYFFGYGNTVWRDQLTDFNGSPVIYDEFGNIINVLNMSMEWDDNGRLISLQTDDYIATFTYNRYGVRDSKTVNGIRTDFLLDGYRVLAEKTDEVIIIYMFDHEYNLIGFILNEERFFYVTNPLGDILGIKNSYLELIVEYSYDAWGNLISISGPEADTIGQLNPFRFRGYRYDRFSSLYYLGSRYYSPVLGRFISPNTSTGIIGNAISHNLYAYALNNPIMFTSPDARFAVSISIAGILITLAVALIAVYSIQVLQVDFVNQFNTAAASLIGEVGQIAASLRDAIAVVLSNTNANHRESTRTSNHVHHIVARTHQRAQSARNIYFLYWNSIDNIINLVSLRSSFHSRLHTNAYFDAVNAILRTANNNSYTVTNRGTHVSNAMHGIRVLLVAANNLAP